MSVVLAEGDVRPGDAIRIELPEAPHQPLKPPVRLPPVWAHAGYSLELPFQPIILPLMQTTVFGIRAPDTRDQAKVLNHFNAMVRDAAAGCPQNFRGSADNN